MSEQDSCRDEGTDTNASIQSSQNHEAVGNTKPATEQQLQDVKREMNAFERSTIRWTRTTAAIGATTAAFICMQWCEMRSGSADTHALAVSAGKQADGTGILAAKMREQVTLIERELKGTQAAQVEFYFGLDGDGNVRVTARNSGHVNATNVTARITLTRRSLLAGKLLFSQKVIGSPYIWSTGPQVFPPTPTAEAGFSANLITGFRQAYEAASRLEEAITLESEEGYNDGFGDDFNKSTCRVFTNFGYDFRDKRVISVGADLMPCEGADGRIQNAITSKINAEKEQREANGNPN